jgi:HD superfamily phosphohydrolase
MAAGFLHDIGHGPFSHVLDYALKKSINRDHEDIASDIIDKLPDLENHGITKEKVKSIIKGKHTYPFISQIINGPLDADKLDYLLRDAHHVGLKYSLDLEHFINHYKILGSDSSNLEKCELGLSNEYAAIVTAEIFIVIWKSMYDLVYHIENSRIAEKMLEKAIITRLGEDSDFKDQFENIDLFIELYDEKLFEYLKERNGLTQKLVTRISDNRLYSKVCENEINIKSFPGLNAKFLDMVDTSAEELSEQLTQKLNNELKLNSYQLICDIIKSRSPKTINVDWDDNSNNEPAELTNVSDIVPAIIGKTRIKVTKSKYEKLITEQLANLINGWS